MQYRIKSCLSALITAGWILFTACENHVIDPLSGKYPEPEAHQLNAILSQDVEKGATTRSFSLEIGDNNSYLAIEFVGPRLNYFLAPGNYTIANRTEAKAGNYVAGDANGGTYWVTSGAKLKLIDGTIFVELTGETYTIRGTVMLEDRSMIRIAYTGLIAFEADPPSFTYSIETTKPYAWTADGTTYTPVPGSQLNKISVLSEGQSIAYFEVVTEENPASLSGTYPVKAVNSLERAVIQGQYLNLAWFGVPFDMIVESGSYYLNGETHMFIREGNIRIADSDGTLAISGSDLSIQDIATQGTFGNLPDKGSIAITDATPGGGSGTVFSNLFAASSVDLSLFGLTGYTVTLKIATSDLTVHVEQGAMGATYTYAGSGQYLSFDFSRDAASLPEGVYQVVPNESAKVGDCISGYPSLFGSGFMGTFAGKVTDGVVSEEVVTGGTVEVTGSGIHFNLTTEGGTISGSYTGTIVLQ
ncbi:MAG: hypothetical protein LBB84_05185 [Tannerellaceae bacterium]|jgi:hypothetical protein|nr:hypothetical protein [Tannerellaceae bacterium]